MTITEAEKIIATRQYRKCRTRKERQEFGQAKSLLRIHNRLPKGRFMSKR